jgi:hypothetical protein
MKSEDEGFAPDPSYMRVQISARFNRRLVKVLKGMAEYMDMPFSALLESIAVTALQGGCLFNEELVKRGEELQKFYGFDEYLDSLAEATEGKEGEEEEE